MQKITVVCLGRLSEQFYADGVKEYEKRLSAFCQFKIIQINEEIIHEKNASAAVVAAALDKEAKKIFEAVPKNAKIVALCIEGGQITSEGFATFLQETAQSGQGNLAFVIGSSHGLAPIVKQKAVLKLSFSKMTFPHQMARLVLTEQIYRAFMIISNAKYHK